MTTAAGNTKIARCCHCRGMMRVTARALSVFCPHCQTRVSLEDFRLVAAHPGKKLATSGDILVEKTARLNLDLVGNRIVIHGRVNGAINASDYVEIGATGQVVGNIKAPKLVVRDGGTMQGAFERVALLQEAPANETPATELAAAAQDEGFAAQSEEPAAAQRAMPRPLRPQGL